MLRSHSGFIASADVYLSFVLFRASFSRSAVRFAVAEDCGAMKKNDRSELLDILTALQKSECIYCQGQKDSKCVRAQVISSASR
jgi:hypothetical protein